MNFWPIALLLSCTSAFAGPLTALELSGSLTSWVVGNQTLTLLASDGYIFQPSMGHRIFGDSATDHIEVVVMSPGYHLSPHWFYLYLGVPQGQTFQLGLYSNATRDPFEPPTLPGLSLFGDGRGDNQSTGYFNILEISYSGTTLQSLAVDFVQYDELDPTAISAGSFRYNSSIPLAPAPEISPFGLSISGLILIGGGVLRKTTLVAGARA